MPQDIARELQTLVDQAIVELDRQSPANVAQRPAPDAWSKAEILGHLIDSAANNHHRFVRAQGVAELDFPPYDPPAWVSCQDYASCEWSQLVTLWVAYNRLLVHVLSVMPAEQLGTPCSVDWYGEPEAIPLRVVVEEYLKHVRHHLAKLAE